MGRNGRTPRITLPVALHLTDQGRYFFNKHPGALSKVHKRGICLDSFQASTLQRLIMADYISILEVEGDGFSGNRRELIDLSKLIIYSSLYGRFNSAVWKDFSSSDMLIQYNRSHPKAPFIKEHLGHGASIDQLSGLAAGEGKKLLDEIAWRASRALEREVRDLDEEERANIRSLAGRYLSNIKSPFWLLLSGSSGHSDFQELTDRIELLLKEFLRKSRISDYVALLIVELLIRSETDLIREAARFLDHPPALKDMLQNSEIRRRLLSAMEKRGRRLRILWKIRGSRHSIGTDNRLEIIIFGSDGDEKRLQEQIVTWKNLDRNKGKPGECYEELCLGSEDPGLLYLNQLEEICLAENIRFESHISRTGEEGTAIRLALHFR